MIHFAEMPPDILEKLREKNTTANRNNYDGNTPPLTDRIKRASAYLLKMDGSISGEGGHNNLYKAAIAVLRGFSLPDDVAFDLLFNEFNVRCTPLWSEKEILHKITEAAKSNAEDGYLLEDAAYSQKTDGNSYTDSEAPPGQKPQTENTDGKHTTTATRLVQLMEEITLFHTPDGKTFAMIRVNGCKEIFLLSGKKFKNYLMGAYWNRHKKPANAQAVSDAMGVLQAKAQFEGEEHSVFTRIAWQGEKVSLYLADKSCRVVEIAPTGWRVCDDSDVYFVKSKNLAPMPEPEPNGDIEALRKFINIPKEDNDTWRLMVAWLVAAFLEGPFTILAVVGESGCAKTTLTRVLTRLVDPSEADLRSLPKHERDLMITAVNGWLLAFDNVSGVPGWLSDALCRLATGSGFSTRELYTDSEETIFKAKRPIIINGIDDMASRGDLLSRTILLSLVPVEKRIAEKEFWGQFEKAQPKIFGSLLTILSKVLSILPTLKVNNLPRMADFARIGVAVEKALHWPDGAFLRAYEANRNTSSALPLESLFAESIIEFMKEKIDWEGTATELLSELNKIVDLDKRNHLKEWPKTSQIIGNKLRRLAPNLRTIGIDVQWGRLEKKRILKIRQQDRTEKTSSSLYTSSSSYEKSPNNDGNDNDDGYFPNFSGRTTEKPKAEEGEKQWNLL